MSGDEASTNYTIEAEEVLRTISENIRKAIEDLSAIVVVTAAADTSVQIKLAMPDGKFDESITTKITAMALTRMELDGDVYTIIPTKSSEPEIREEVMRLHKDNIELATRNWKNFVEGIQSIVEIAANIAGVKLPNSRAKPMMTMHTPLAT
jgi:hypothetical protein